MTSPILYAGGEDISFTPVNNSFVSGVPTTFGTFGPDTTANGFRSGYGRFGFAIVSSFGNGGTTVDTSHYARTNPAFASSSFWVSMRVNTKSAGASNAFTGAYIPIRFVDSGGVVRLNIKLSAANPSPNDTFIVNTLNAAGTSTQIGSTSTGRFMSFSTSGSYAGTPDKIDIFVNYAVSGQFTVYCNGVQTFTYSGDITTNGQTSLAFVDIGQATFCNVNGITSLTTYSEVVVSTRDTRNFSLVTQAATALGNTDTFTSGSVAGINLNYATDATPDYSNTAAQVQQYQVTPAMPSGNFAVISVVQHVRATVGATGPTHLDLCVRTGGSDYFSSDLAPGGAWGTLAYNWDTNPNTSAAWATTDLAASSSSFNFGYKSIT